MYIQYNTIQYNIVQITYVQDKAPYIPIPSEATYYYTVTIKKFRKKKKKPGQHNPRNVMNRTWHDILGTERLMR